MTRRAVLPALCAALLGVGGCGGAGGQASQAGGGPPPATDSGNSGSTQTGFSETSGSATATTSPEPSPPAPALVPPRVVLDSTAGRQQAVQESYCVQKVDTAGSGTGACGDTPRHAPKRLTVVKFGEAVVISLAGGAFVEKPAGCTPDCPPTATVHPLGCRSQPPLETVHLQPGRTSWTVDLPPGPYELAVFGHFQAPNGVTGDTSAVLGLLVDPGRRPAIVKATAALFVCPSSEHG